MLKFFTKIMLVFVIFTTAITVVTGCHMVEINIVQRTNSDLGDNTEDSYSDKIKRYEKEEGQMKLIAPIE